MVNKILRNAGIISIMIGFLSLISAIVFSIYQAHQAYELFSSQLIAAKVDSTVEDINYLRMKYNDLRAVCDYRKNDLSLIKTLFFAHQDASEKLLSKNHNFKIRLGKKEVMEIKCYGDFHANLIFNIKKGGYCTNKESKISACEKLKNEYENNCYDSFARGNDMKLWSLCISDSITKDIESRYGINVSKFTSYISMA